ncbi:YheC/YheD family protein, partial [Paenibacillus zanthoxyli]|uniref:YheC/YheD family protein n=1 Tax=Paenibacillus zanthoxyli TaxID=369399 RepID=UPI00055D6109
LGLDAASFLEDSFGTLCELALDLAIDREGRVFVLEVNPKPAREVFSRAGERDTYHKALQRPLEYALWVYRTKLSPSPSKKIEE